MFRKFAEEEDFDFEEEDIRYKKDVEKIAKYLIIGGIFETKEGIEYDFYKGINDDIKIDHKGTG